MKGYLNLKTDKKLSEVKGFPRVISYWQTGVLPTQIFAYVDVQFDNVYWLITELCLCFFLYWSDRFKPRH